MLTIGIAAILAVEVPGGHIDQVPDKPAIREDYLRTLAGSTEDRHGPRWEVTLATAFRVERDGGSAALNIPAIIFAEPAGEDHLPESSSHFVQIERMRYAQGTTSGSSIVPGYTGTTSATSIGTCAVNVVDIRLYWKSVAEGQGPGSILAPFGITVTATSSGTSLHQGRAGST